MLICTNCGEENPERFRLCGFCGTPLPGALPVHEMRKTVTIVFSDLVGSTKLGEALDSETLREVLRRYFDEMKAVLEEHGGTVEKYIGDAVMAVFGLPTLHEDDALRAVRAAEGMQQRLATLNDELERGWGVRLTNRTGVNTGEVVTGDPAAGQHLVTGDAVNVAARLEQAAPGLEILIGEKTYRLVRDAVEVEPVEPLELKGKSERVPAYRLLGLTAETDADVAPLVGRARELELLLAELEQAVEARACRLVTVVGDAGVGKTRLVEELAAHVAPEVLVLRGRCLSYGRGITFWPLVEMVRQAAEIHGDDSADEAHAKVLALAGDDLEVGERVASAIGLSRKQFALDDLFWGARKLIESPRGGAAARRRRRGRPLGGDDLPRPDRLREGRGPRVSRCSSSASRARTSTSFGPSGRGATTWSGSSSGRSRPPRARSSSPSCSRAPSSTQTSSGESSRRGKATRSSCGSCSRR